MAKVELSDYVLDRIYKLAEACPDEDIGPTDETEAYIRTLAPHRIKAVITMLRDARAALKIAVEALEAIANDNYVETFDRDEFYQMARKALEQIRKIGT